MTNTFNRVLKDYSKTIEALQLIVIFICALVLPLVVTGSQIVVGSIVNTALILTALNVKGKSKTMVITTLPSVVTITSGLVFKSASILMLYMIPGIWLGNFAMIYMYKKLLVNEKKNYILTSILAVFIKVMIIFGTFSILNMLNVFPEKMVQTLSVAMSFNQCITATIGASICYIVYRIEERDN